MERTLIRNNLVRRQVQNYMKKCQSLPQADITCLARTEEWEEMLIKFAEEAPLEMLPLLVKTTNVANEARKQAIVAREAYNRAIAAEQDHNRAAANEEARKRSTGSDDIARAAVKRKKLDDAENPEEEVPTAGLRLTSAAMIDTSGFVHHDHDDDQDDTDSMPPESATNHKLQATPISIRPCANYEVNNSDRQDRFSLPASDESSIVYESEYKTSEPPIQEFSRQASVLSSDGSSTRIDTATFPQNQSSLYRHMDASALDSTIVGHFMPTFSQNSLISNLGRAQVNLGPVSGYALELAITAGFDHVLIRIKEECQPLKHPHENRLPPKKVNDEIEEILRSLSKLDPVIVTDDLVEHLTNRLKVKEYINIDDMEMPATWTMSDPGEIFRAIHGIMMASIDGKIHRALGEMILFHLVNATVEKRTTLPLVAQPHLFDHADVLEDLAREAAGHVSDKEVKKKTNHFKHSYYAGKKWLEIVESFGGNGIVLIFVIAGTFRTIPTRNSYVDSGWTEFQRRCLGHISQYMLRIKKLVKILGRNALDVYCRDGCLPQETVDKVETFLDQDEDKDDPSKDDSMECVLVGEEREG
ncbi:MAG: hypothetical protein Q9164_001393 [Protoblastenia rupestris]